MLWNFLSRPAAFGEPYLKPHVVSEELIHQVCDSLISRGISEVEWKETKSTALDPGGVMWKDRHVFTFEIDELNVNIAAVDMGLYYSIIQELEPRNDIGREYYKIHGCWTALCITEEQRENLLILMSSEMPSARAIAQLEMEYFKDTGTDAVVIDFQKYKEKRGLQ